MNGESGGGQTTRRLSAGTELTPGMVFGRGRYRLLAQVGVDPRCSAQLWRGRDLVLDRDVAITVLLAEPGVEQAAEQARDIARRALRTARLESSGAARVLDILEAGNGADAIAPGVAGAVIAEWTPGRSLTDVVTEGLPPPAAAAAALVPLAEAVDAAHRIGVVLGCDHPERIRATRHGHARLAFPGPLPDAATRDDVRGLGGALYLLLTGKWPLEGGSPSVPGAPRGPDGNLVSPRSLRPAVPLELSTLALRSIGGSSNEVHTGAAVRRVLELYSSSDDDVELVPTMPRGTVSGQAYRGSRDSESRRMKLGIAVSALAVLTLLVLTWIGVSVTNFFANTDDNRQPAVVVGQPEEQQPGQEPAPARPVTVAAVDVYDVTGDPDNPGRVERVVDGDPETVWTTYEYQQQFPELKPGVGVMVTLDQPVAVAAVAVDSPSPGTRLEVRAAPDPDAELEETQVIGIATLADGRTDIPLSRAPPTKYLLLWIVELGGDGEENVSGLAELSILRAA